MRWVYFSLHFAIGFFALWLSYTYAKLSFLAGSPPLWLEGLVETSYLVLGVTWGNIGWNSFTRKIPRGASASLVTYAISNTVAPLAIILPIFINAVDLVRRGPVLWFYTFRTWQNLVLIASALILLFIYLRYRRSEMATLYRAYGA